MLELTRPFGAPVRPFISPLITFGVAREPWQIRAYWQLRSEIFCGELALFADAELEHDAQDAFALPIVAIAHSAGTPEAVVGVVRVYAADGGAWYGGRLGVAAGYRVRSQVGAGLIACAVRTAADHGCQQFFATVLAQNVRYFQRQHFSVLSPLEMCGRSHVLMQADVAAHASRAQPAIAERPAL